VSFDFRDYLVVARFLADRSGSEARYRSAVSRAYYAAYHVARPKAQRRDTTITAGDHKKVWQALRGEDRAVASKGERLRKSRVWADYRPENQLPQSEATLAVQWAEELVTALNGIP
jgi:uncharacterized protein (UPF0332 family)